SRDLGGGVVAGGVMTRQAVHTRIVEAAEEVGIEKPTLEEAKAIPTPAGPPGRQVRGYAGEKGTGESQRFLSDPGLYSPFVDEIAIERALAFDWDVIARLSMRETEVFYDRLAEMDDPFEDIASTHPIPRKQGSGSTEIDLETPRRKRWREGGDLWRDRIVSAVYRRRRARKAA